MEDIERLDLSDNKRLDNVRDLFLIGCYTGLRYSDFSILTPENIKGGFIRITQVKTGNPVVIPLHPTIKRIIAKHNGALPPAISNQKTNEYLKEVGKRVASLQTVVSRTFTKGGMRVVKTNKKWELVSTHTARRSFATNEYLDGTPTLTIMAITGHKTEKAFLKYIRITKTEHAEKLSKLWEERENLSSLRAVV